MCMCYYTLAVAPVAELADALDLGSSIERCAGSIPVRCTKNKRQIASASAVYFTFVLLTNY